jgi:bleomycin hydrolase
MCSLTKYSFSLISKTFHSTILFVFKVDEVKPMTNQKSSGRCWIFALLNAMRIPFVKQYNLEEFEFSQAHLFFWDKVKYFS